MAVTIKKADDSLRPWEMPKGTWKRFYTTEGKATASLTCPGCGLRGTLEDHEISVDGVVSPSIDCPVGCGFHDFGVLEGWSR